MDSLSYIVPFLFVGGAGALVLFIVAVIQEGKSEHKGSFRWSFYTIVSLVMLTITVGASIALLNIGFRQYVFRSANTYDQRYQSPPTLVLVSSPNGAAGKETSVVEPVPVSGALYQCTSGCQFTDDDKQAVASWQTQYKQWQDEQTLSLTTRRNLATSLGFLIVGAPLFIVFFRMMRKRPTDAQKSSPLHAFYFYGVAFAGLVMAVVAAGIVINDGLQVWLKTGPTNNSFVQPLSVASNAYGVKSLLACKDKCGFTAEQVALANQWIADDASYTERQQSNVGQYSGQMAGAIPFVLVGLTLFFYHFTTIRRETSDSSTPTPPASIS